MQAAAELQQMPSRYMSTLPVAKQPLPLLTLALAAVQATGQVTAASNCIHDARVEGVGLQRMHVPAQCLAAVGPAAAILLALLLGTAQHTTNLQDMTAADVQASTGMLSVPCSVQDAYAEGEAANNCSCISMRPALKHSTCPCKQLPNSYHTTTAQQTPTAAQHQPTGLQLPCMSTYEQLSNSPQPPP